MKNKDFIVYCHKNKINNKRYIGITGLDFNKRCGKNGKQYLVKTNGKFHQPIFARAILKYGWDAFEHIILYSNLFEEEAKQKEISLINYYKTTNKAFGYNITIGGEGHKKYKSNTDKQQAFILRQQQQYIEHKERLKTDQDFHEHCLAVRRQWYKNKVNNNEEYHNYVLQKNKQSKENHKKLATDTQLQKEKEQHTANVKAIRLALNAKKEYLKVLISENKNYLKSANAVDYLNSIKWYKIQSLIKIQQIEQKLMELIAIAKNTN